MSHSTLDYPGNRDAVANIPVALSTQFLHHFSEQLYSSPQKAFEELISNGWDAGASIVDVHIAPDLRAPDATLAVFDNGTSMDLPGLHALWQIAFSPKEGSASQHGRPIIGKFGIGKLATYVLAQRLTYICKARDGVIRQVAINFGLVDEHSASDDHRLINDLQLPVYELDDQALTKALEATFGGDRIRQLVDRGASALPFADTAGDRTESLHAGEYGGVPADLTLQEPDTWTLVVLSDLKTAGRALKTGILRRMLAAALPFGSEMAIRVNGERLLSAKLQTPIVKAWEIGPDLGIDCIENDDTGILSSSSGEQGSRAAAPDHDAHGSPIRIASGSSPYPHVDLPEIGRVTGWMTLFEERVSGGKSEGRGASNGFHVNVMGRVINQLDPSFGQENLSHAAWSRFRMTVRADGLNDLLTTNREQFKDRHETRIFRAFLRKCFNTARAEYERDAAATLPDGGDALVQSLGVVSLSSLRSVVSEALRTQPAIAGMFDETGIDDRESRRRTWRRDTSENIRKSLGQIRVEALGDDSFVKFRIRDGSILVNKEHPLVAEHSRSRAEMDLVRTMAVIDLLSDVYALDIGIDPSTLNNIRGYREQLLRFRAVQRRESGLLIAQLLNTSQHDSDNSERFETAVSDALRCLDFEVRPLGGAGRPDGIARAFPTPSQRAPTRDDPNPALYSFVFDAKSSRHSVAKTGNVSLDALVQHREECGADYALVVAPGFSDGALATRCEHLGVTPMTASDLGSLLAFIAEYGAIPLTTIREVFEFFDPRQVSEWVSALPDQLLSQRKLTIDGFIEALDGLKGKAPEPDSLTASLIAYKCREDLGLAEVGNSDVIALAKGIEVIVPDLVAVENDRIVVDASASRLAEAIKSQLEGLHGRGRKDGG